MKKFSYEDLQPHIEMLIDALENKGSCASGLPYSNGVKEQAQLYRTLLSFVRSGNHTLELLMQDLYDYRHRTMALVGNNQRYRIGQILNALDSYMVKEYNKHND